MKDQIKILFQFVKNLLRFKAERYQPGLSALVCCKDEEHNITACLNSISQFANQIICVDNGSNDRTLSMMQDFKDTRQDLDVSVIDAKGLLLLHARNKGLEMVKHQWLLHSGGDFVFYTANEHPFRKLLDRIIKSNAYTAWRFKHVNLYGDLHHTYKTMKTVQHGEHYLMRMDQKLKFIEEGKFDYLKLPWYYISHKTEHPCFFHLDGLKSDMRLIYRNAYFEWRQLVNQTKGEAIEKVNDFDKFFDLWKLELFVTIDPKKLKYRFQKQLAKLHFMRYEEKAFYEYPVFVKELINERKERFEVMYHNGVAVGRMDKMDVEMANFLPEQDDLNWDVGKYEAKYASKHYLRNIKNKMTGNAESEG